MLVFQVFKKSINR